MHIPFAETGLGNLAVMHDYFQSSHIEGEDALVFAFITVTVVLVIGAAYILLKRKMLRQKYKPRGSIKERENIAKMFNLCVDYRIKLDVYVEKESGGRYITCFPVSFENDILHLECTAADIPASFLSDKTKEFLFYFKYKVGSKILNYYFKSLVVSFFLEQNGFLNLSIALPQIIELGQKRGALRIRPPDKLVMEVSIWPLSPPFLNKQNRPLSDVAKWGSGILKCANDDFLQFRLQDISAQGVKVLVPKDNANAQSGLSFASVATQMVFKFDLWDPAQQHSLVIWTIGRIKKTTQDYTTKATQAGIQFIAWALPGGDNAQTLKWRELAEGEVVEVLADWVLQRHLELCREESLFAPADKRQG